MYNIPTYLRNFAKTIMKITETIIFIIKMNCQ